MFEAERHHARSGLNEPCAACAASGDSAAARRQRGQLERGTRTDASRPAPAVKVSHAGSAAAVQPDYRSDVALGWHCRAARLLYCDITAASLSHACCITVTCLLRITVTWQRVQWMGVVADLAQPEAAFVVTAMQDASVLTGLAESVIAAGVSQPKVRPVCLITCSGHV